jgi:hypothetical protein
MLNRSTAFWVGMLGAALFAAPLSTAHALTMKECSAKYQAAKSAGTLSGMKWNDFRKAECGAGATAAPANADVGAGAATPPPRSGTAPARPVAIPTRSDAVFPPSVSSRYSSESAGRARMHTCLDQYNANKTSNGNGGLRWIQKGGGYYSECNRRLKGA